MRNMSAFVSVGGLVGRSAFTGSRSASTCDVLGRLVIPLRVQCNRLIAPKMATQQETAWNPVKVVENSPAAEDHRYVVIEVGVTSAKGSLIDSYRTPGQYVQIRPPGGEKPGFFAISCAPNIQGFFEFLIKETEGSDWICKAKVGDVVEMSPVSGKGFPMSEGLFEVKDVLLFATGSGIAPIRAAIESPLNGVFPLRRRSVKLYYGCRYPERMAYRDRLKLWRSDRVDVTEVFSQPEKSKEKWYGATGYVQDALKAEGVKNPADTAAIMCGVKGMTDDVRAYLISQGVQENRILTNF